MEKTLLDAESKNTLVSEELSQEKEAEAIFAQIAQFHKQGQYEKVLELTEEAMKLEPSNGNLVLLMGLVNRDLGKNTQAVHWLRKAWDDYGMVEAKDELKRLCQTGTAGEKIVDGEKTQEKELCKYPAPGTPLYTAEEYRAFLKKYPDISEAERAKLAEKEGRGFGYQYMSIANAATSVYHKTTWKKWNDLLVQTSNNGSIGASAKETCKTLNSVNDSVRWDVARTMQAYLEAQDRTIDCWPDSRTDAGFVADNIGDGTQVTLRFDYFACDYKETEKDGKHDISRKRGKTYRNPYDHKWLEKPQELINIENKIHELKKVPVYTEKQRKSSQRCAVISLLPLLLLLVNVFVMYVVGTEHDVLGLKNVFLSIVDKVKEFRNSGMLGKIVTFVPILVEMIFGTIMLLVYMIAEIFHAERIAAVILVIVSLIFGTVAYGWCMKGLGHGNGVIKRKDVRAGEEAMAEAKRLDSDNRTKQLREEYSKTRKDAKQLAEEWHRKWFDACR